MSQLLLLALLLSVGWLAAIALLPIPEWVGAVGVGVFFIVALWLGAWLDATEYEEGE